MDELHFDFEYEWEPFRVGGRHLTFEEHITARLERTRCSHRGAAIYKWEGSVTEGPHIGKTGILIGETNNIRQRIKAYVNGTQPEGNLYWRENFLQKGDIRLYILRLHQATFGTEESNLIALDLQDFSSGSRRLVFEQLLISNELASNRPDVWLVNRKL